MFLLPKKTCPTAVVIAVLIFSLSNLKEAFSKKNSNTEKKSYSDMSSYLDLRKNISKNEQRQRDFLASLYEVNERIKKNRQKKTFFSEYLFSLKFQSQQIAQQIVFSEKEVEKQEKIFLKQIQNLYKLSQVHYLEFLFSSISVLDWERNLKYIKQITWTHHEKLKNYKNSLTTLSLQRKKLKKSVRKLVLMKKNMALEEKKLKQAQKQKLDLIRILREKNKENVKNLQAVKVGTRDLYQKMEIKNKEAPFQYSLLEFKGHLPLPIKGSLLRPFGATGDLGYGFPFYHKGELYETSLDNSVRSVFPGKVAFVGKLRGYENVIVLDHGDHYYSVYANLSHTFVKKGENVAQSQVLAKAVIRFDVKEEEENLEKKKEAFSLRSFMKTGLHFEIRHFSDALNPSDWLKKPNYSKEKQKKKNKNIRINLVQRDKGL